MKISLLSAFLLFLASSVTQAGSATWRLDPTSNGWNTPNNWTPATVPKMPTDTATFDVSQTTDIAVSTSFGLNGIVFNPGASAYTISLTGNLTISGAGIVNNSGVTQNVPCNVLSNGNFGIINFTNNATSGESVNYDVKGGPRADFLGGKIWFYDHSSAGSGVFTTSGGLDGAASGSYIYFLDESSATHSTFISNGGAAGAAGGLILFGASSSLTESSVVVNGAPALGGVYGSFICATTVPLVDVTVTTNSGPGTETKFGAGASYFDSQSAQGCTFTCNGGSNLNDSGGYTQFSNTFDTGNSALIANGGTNGAFGGQFYLLDACVVGGRVELFGNGVIYTGFHDAPGAAIGSVEGDGTVVMGGLNLTVGSNSLSTTFSGSLEGDSGSSLTKVGTGTLTLSGADNTYTDGTTILSGTLKVNNTAGSGTGTGAVSVEGGSLAGQGIISGPVTIGTGSGAGAFLAPGKGASKPTTLTLQSMLTFKGDGSYTHKLNTKKAKADQVIANGVTIESGALFDLTKVGNKKLITGKVFTAISNTSANPISGTFVNLADGSTVTVGVNKLQVSYTGGDGNDLTLTVVP